LGIEEKSEHTAWKIDLSLPVFMLRKVHMDNPSGTPGPAAAAPNSAGFDGGRQG
jgi:hypothetical protein